MGSEKHTCPALSEHMMCEKNSLLPQLLVFCYLGIPRHFVPAKVERGGCRSHSRRLDDDFFVVEIDSFVLLHFFHERLSSFYGQIRNPVNTWLHHRSNCLLAMAKRSRPFCLSPIFVFTKSITPPPLNQSTSSHHKFARVHQLTDTENAPTVDAMAATRIRLVFIVLVIIIHDCVMS